MKVVKASRTLALMR